ITTRAVLGEVVVGATTTGRTSTDMDGCMRTSVMTTSGTRSLTTSISSGALGAWPIILCPGRSNNPAIPSRNSAESSATTMESSAMAYLVAGGTWMFYQRSLRPQDFHVVQETLANSPDDPVMSTWVIMALFACAFLVPTIVSLTAQAAVLGASGR